MNSRLFILGASASVMLMAGCGTTTTIINDPSSFETNVRQEGAVSSEEMRKVTLAAVNNAMTSPKFVNFLKKYQREMNDELAIPVLKLDKVVNDTDDPDLNVSEITDMLNEALINAGKVDVTLAEGFGRTKAVAASRELEDDENFDQKTVAKRGTLQAARLLMRPKVISNRVTNGSQKVIMRTFVMDMVDIKTGLIMWKFTKQLGWMDEKGTFGW